MLQYEYEKRKNRRSKMTYKTPPLSQTAQETTEYLEALVNCLSLKSWEDLETLSDRIQKHIEEIMDWEGTTIASPLEDLKAYVKEFLLHYGSIEKSDGQIIFHLTSGIESSSLTLPPTTALYHETRIVKGSWIPGLFKTLNN
jgi:hypothetical protein